MPEIAIITGQQALLYALSLPAAAAGNPWPVLCFLHGSGEGAPPAPPNDDDARKKLIHAALTTHGPLKPGSAPVATNEFIVVAPQLPIIGKDIWQQYADVVRQIVQAVQEQYNGDPRRTYLTGFSFGGNGVLDLALAPPDLWAALWPVDPTRAPAVAPQQPIWLSAGERARARGAVESAGRFRFGELTLTPAAAEPAGERLYDDRGLAHVPTATAAYGDQQVYDWLRTKQRD